MFLVTVLLPLVIPHGLVVILLYFLATTLGILTPLLLPWFLIFLAVGALIKYLLKKK